MSSVEVRDLAIGIDKKLVAEGISFDVDEGRFLALVGPNGCGKSTLLRTIAGVLPPLAGTISVAGHRLTDLRPRQRAHQLALVGQDDAPGDDNLVREVVALGRVAHRPPWSPGDADDGKAVAKALDAVGLSGFGDRSFARLSGGERRRVLIARGLAQETPILMLDEPTNHLDVGQQFALLERLSARGGTQLAALHDLSLAMRYADDAVVLHDGKQVAFGPVTEVFTPQLLESAFSVRGESVIDPVTGRATVLLAPLTER